jgi:hypothetical protein
LLARNLHELLEYGRGAGKRAKSIHPKKELRAAFARRNQGANVHISLAGSHRESLF